MLICWVRDYRSTQLLSVLHDHIVIFCLCIYRHRRCRRLCGINQKAMELNHVWVLAYRRSSCQSIEFVQTNKSCNVFQKCHFGQVECKWNSSFGLAYLELSPLFKGWSPDWWNHLRNEVLIGWLQVVRKCYPSLKESGHRLKLLQTPRFLKLFSRHCTRCILFHYWECCIWYHF